MQTLNPILKQRLLAQHAYLGEATPERRLTATVLDRYDGLVQMHCELCRITSDSFRWPYSTEKKNGAKTAAHVESGETPAATPFDKLVAQKPASPQEAVTMVEDTMSAVVDYYMPYFHSVHEQWVRQQQREAVRIAKRAYA